MLPVLQMRVSLRADNSGNTAIQGVVYQALKAATPWDCGKIASYDVEDTTTRKRVQIESLRLEGAPPVCTAAGGPYYQQPTVLLVLNPGGIGKSDKLTVALANLPAPLTSAPSAAVSLSDAQVAKYATVPYALTVTPQAAPQELMTSGLKRDTGQLAIAFTAPEIARGFHGAAVYASSTDLFSTDERDAKSAFAASLGLKRGLATNWYVPASLQETIQGNQVATNLSAVTTASATSLAPLGWSKGALYNNYVQAPNPPELTLSASYTHRVNQLVTKTSPLLAVDDVGLNPYASFTPIYLFNNLCNWMHKPKAGAAAAPAPAAAGGAAAAAPGPSKQYCLGLQTDMGMWYLPLDTTAKGSQKAEGYGDVSILIPISDIPFSSSALTNLIMGSPTSSQLRIKYSDDVNAANNYARTRQWTFAFEVIK